MHQRYRILGLYSRPLTERIPGYFIIRYNTSCILSGEMPNERRYHESSPWVHLCRNSSQDGGG